MRRNSEIYTKQQKEANTSPKILIFPNTLNTCQILDATFDDLLPLAIPRMPASLSTIVTRAVEKFINLNIGEQLSHYSGPLRSSVDLDQPSLSLKIVFAGSTGGVTMR